MTDDPFYLPRRQRRRDYQRNKLFTAENTAAWTSKALRPVDPNADAVGAVANRMLRWLHDNGYRVATLRPDITIRRGDSAWACQMTGSMSFGTTLLARRPWVIAHEVAHLVIPTVAAFPGREWDTDGTSHGWEFCDVYLRLVRRFYGVANHDALKASFKAHKVRFRPKRRMSPEARAAAAARLAANRPARTAAPTVWVVRVAVLDDGRAVYRSRLARHRVTAPVTMDDGTPGWGTWFGATVRLSEAVTRVNRDKAALLASESDVLVEVDRSLLG